MSKRIAYLHSDAETASLKAWKGHIRSLGIVATTGDLNVIRTWEWADVIHPDLWHPDTLGWAVKTYGDDFVAKQMHGLTDWRHVWHHCTDFFSGVVKELEDLGYEVWIIANHTNFDVTLLQVAYDMLSRTYPIKHNHVYDLQSLLMGQASEKAEPEIGIQVKGLYEVRAYADTRGKAGVTHCALDDAWGQLQMLQNANLTLPMGGNLEPRSRR